MKIHSESRIQFPLARVYETYRDRLPEIAAFMPDIREIEVKSRAPGPRGPRIHNIWRASTEIPSIAQGIVRPDMLCWDDHAEWDDAAHHVDWALVIPAFQEQVRCRGRNAFFADGPQATRVVLSGDLDIHLSRIPGVPSLLAGRIAPQVEKFILKLVQPNLENVNRYLERFLQAQG